MTRILKSKRIYKKLIILAIAVYIAYVFVSQQRVLESYRASERYYLNQIEVKSARRDSLAETRANINSEEHIERMARERLDMFLPNERVYVNISR